MTDRELMQMVLKKLDHIWELGVEVESYRLSDDLLPEMKALRDRLAQPEPEPVAWGNKKGEFKVHQEADEDFKSTAIPFYAAPLKREWVGLTDEEFVGQIHEHLEDMLSEANATNACAVEFAKLIEAKLKEKNT